jgi:hypothetical protein
MLLDTRPLAGQILDLLEGTPRFHELSAKFAVQLDGGEGLAMLEHPHDLWLSAARLEQRTWLAFGLAGCPATRQWARCRWSRGWRWSGSACALSRPGHARAVAHAPVAGDLQRRAVHRRAGHPPRRCRAGWRRAQAPGAWLGVLAQGQAWPSAWPRRWGA